MNLLSGKKEKIDAYLKDARDLFGECSNSYINIKAFLSEAKTKIISFNEFEEEFKTIKNGFEKAVELIKGILSRGRKSELPPDLVKELSNKGFFIRLAQFKGKLFDTKSATEKEINEFITNWKQILDSFKKETESLA